MANTHVYHIVGDGHVRGAAGGQQPQLLDPLRGMTLALAGVVTPPVLNTIVTGATSGATARVTALANAGGGTYQLTLETLNLLSFTAGETCNFDSGGSGLLLTLASLHQAPVTAQFIPETRDAALQAITPANQADTPFWDRWSKVASELVLAAGYTGTFTVGQRVTTSGGGAFTVLTSGAGAGGTLVLKVVRKAGTIAAAQTVTGPTGSGTISTYGGDLAAGNWLPHAHQPNLGGTGTYFERIPQGSGYTRSDGTVVASIGVEKWIVENAVAKHAAAADPNDRGARVIQFSTFDDYTPGTTSPFIAGVVIQNVLCSGSFPTTWVIGETVTGPGGWSAKVHSFNAAQKYLHVVEPNGQTLTAGTVTGATSGATATASECLGWQKGSAYWNNWVANKAAALAATGGLYAGQPAKHEAAFLSIWEGETVVLGSVVGAAIPSWERALEEWIRFLADFRAELGDDELPVTLFYGDDRQHGADLPGASYLLRSWLLGVSVRVPRVFLTTADGLQGSQSSGLPYPAAFNVWRPLDYVEIGWRAWRSLEHAMSEPATGNFEPLPLILIAGQSQAVGGIPFMLSAIDKDPDLYSSAVFPGVSTVDTKVWSWHATAHAWQNYDVALNANTFYGAPAGTFGLETSLLLRQKFRFGENNQAGEVGVIKLAVGGSSCAASSVGAAATWDPLGSVRPQTNVQATCTAMAASPPATPARGRFTAVAGTFSSFPVGQSVQVSGSALGTLGYGGNNTLATGVAGVHAVAADGSWVELVGAFVTEGLTWFAFTVGPPPLVDLVETEIRLALEKCVTQLRRIPKPVLKVWWQGESDLGNIAAYKAALLRVLQWLEDIFGQRHKGETPTATVLLKLTSRTPWGVSDTAIAQLREIQDQVAAELGNARAVSTDNLPLESSGVWPRTTRAHNGVHHTPRGFIQAGYLADSAANGLVGIPDYPASLAGVDYFLDEGGAAGAGGTDTTSGTDSTAEAESTPTTDGATGTDETTPETATGILEQVEAELQGGGIGVAGYTVNGRTVQNRSLSELIELHRYMTAQNQRARGIRRTRVSFN